MAYAGNGWAAGPSFGASSSAAAPAFLFGAKPPAGADGGAPSQPAATPALSLGFQLPGSQVRPSLSVSHQLQTFATGLHRPSDHDRHQKRRAHALQANDGLFKFGASQATVSNGQTAAQAGSGGAIGLSPSTSAGNESLVGQRTPSMLPYDPVYQGLSMSAHL